MKVSIYIALFVTLLSLQGFASESVLETKFTEATVVLKGIIAAEEKHLEEMGSYISAMSSSEVRYNLEISIPLDSYFNYTIIFSNGCYRATAELLKDVGKANKGDRIIVTCDGTKEVLPSYSALKKYLKVFLK